TASAHIVTTVISSDVLSLAWSTAQLGWITRPTVLFLFSFVTYYTAPTTPIPESGTTLTLTPSNHFSVYTKISPTNSTSVYSNGFNF
ncbi:Amino acid permease 4, partial [Linum perenne]